MNDRELLEMAAKAAGYSPWGTDCEGCPIFVIDGHPMGWNPLTEDGDALRLAVKLRIAVDPLYEEVCSYTRFNHYLHMEDENEAIRRAITRAAAEIGRAMK